jgi:hypothetical protein
VVLLVTDRVIPGKTAPVASATVPSNFFFSKSGGMLSPRQPIKTQKSVTRRKRGFSVFQKTFTPLLTTREKTVQTQID